MLKLVAVYRNEYRVMIDNIVVFLSTYLDNVFLCRILVFEHSKYHCTRYVLSAESNSWADAPDSAHAVMAIIYVSVRSSIQK